MKEPKLPKQIFVRWNGNGNDRYLDATSHPENAIDDDGPTVVGTYKLVGTQTLKKRIEIVK